MVGAPDADILAAAIAILRKRIAAGTATFLVKVKAHQGEPANEEDNIMADKAISDLKVGKDWCQRKNRAVFTWENPCREAGKVTDQDRHSTFNNNVTDAIRRGAAQSMKCSIGLISIETYTVCVLETYTVCAQPAPTVLPNRRRLRTGPCISRPP